MFRLMCVTLLVIFVETQERCKCTDPQCLGTSIPPKGLCRSSGSGTIVTTHLTERPDLSSWYSEKESVLDIGLHESTGLSVRAPQGVVEAVQGGPLEHCEWVITPVQGGVYQFITGTQKSEPILLTTTTGFTNPGGYNLTHCTGEMTVWYCEDGTNTGYLTTSCPPPICFNKVGVALSVKPGTCGTDKGVSDLRIRKGSHSGGYECCTQHGCTQAAEAEIYSAPLETGNCFATVLTVVTFHKTPGAMGYTRGALTKHYDGTEDEGWKSYEIISGRSEESFIKCCGFLLGVGGALFQAYLNREQKGGGGADPVDVQNKMNEIVNELNRISTSLQQSIGVVREIAIKNQVGVMKNTIRIGLVEAYLNITSTVEQETFRKLEQELANEGWCQMNLHCWCPPLNETLPTIRPAGQIGPIASVGGADWWLTALIIGLIIVVAFVILYLLCKMRKSGECPMFCL